MRIGAVLHGILGVVVTQHACRMAIQRSLDVTSKLLESAGVAFSRAIEERIARFSGLRPHQRSFARSRRLL